MTSEQMRAMPPPPPHNDGWLYRDSLAVIYGPSGLGKTHVAVDIAASVTSRQHWKGASVHNGPVLYVVAEGVSGIGVRTEAWEDWHGTACEVTWLPEAVNLTSPQWAAALAEVVAELRPVLVVIDTFARSIVGADENSARDIGVVVAHLDLIRRAAGSCVLLVHHPGKEARQGARGSSALRGALDTELELGGDDRRLWLRNPKQKNAAEHPPLPLTLTAHAASVVVIDGAGVGPEADLPESVHATLDALRAIDVPGGIPPAAWLKAVDGIAERTFYRHRSGLLAHGQVVNVGTDKQPKYRPADVVALASEGGAEAGDGS
jgi:hypothetical protein